MLVTHGEVVDSSVDLRDGLGGESNHVALETGSSNGELHLVVAELSLDGRQEQREGVDLSRLIAIGLLLVIGAVATGVLPIDIYVNC